MYREAAAELSPLHLEGARAEHELMQALARLVKDRELPDLAEIEPGAFLHLVHRAWIDSQRRDSRRGRMTESQLAAKIRDIAKRDFTRNQFQTSFGEGKKAHDGGPRYKTGIPRDVAWAYMRIAFDHWTGRADPSPLLMDGHRISDEVINMACAAMFPAGGRPGPELLVYCRESPGFGVKSFYRECGQHSRSLIVSTAGRAFVMDDIGEDFAKWEEVLRALFSRHQAERQQSASAESIHVWAMREPLVAADARSIRALDGIAQLQGLLKIELALDSARSGKAGGEPANSLWKQIDRRCVIAIKLHASNDSIRLEGTADTGHALSGPPVLPEEFIFPPVLPLEWGRRGVTTARDGHVISVITIDQRREITFNGFAPTASARAAGSIIQVPSPSPACSDAFLTLFDASMAAVSGDDKAPTLLQARTEGWIFVSPSNFIGLPLPLPRDNQFFLRSSQ